jgi:uncharacterized membrane protein
MILKYTIIVFITQLVFIGCRTWNIIAISKKDIPAVLVSGTFVHLSWLVSIAIGAVSMNEILVNFEWKYLPVVLASLSGGLIGSYMSMKSKKL